MKMLRIDWVLLPLLMVVSAGCGQADSPSEPAVDGSAYLLSREPEAAVGVRQVRETAQTGDDVVIIGRIGGSTNPWVEGLAAFMIVDPSIKHCWELADDGCPTPWDYC